MGNITTTNRMAILDLIAQADETTEVTSIENRLTDLEDFIQVDATSGYATFSASQSIVSTVTDGTSTNTLIHATTYTNIEINDGTRTSQQVLDPTNNSNMIQIYDNASPNILSILEQTETTINISSGDGTKYSQILIDPQGNIDQTLIGEVDGDKYAEVRFATTGGANIVFQAGDSSSSIGGNINCGENEVNMISGDGTDTSTIKATFSNILLQTLNGVSNEESKVELTTTSTIISSTDGTSTSTQTIEPTYIEIIGNSGAEDYVSSVFIDGYNISAGFSYTGTGPTVLYPRLTIDTTELVIDGGNTEVIKLTNIPTYADNAAAVADGLPTDAVYKTSGGELRIVV
jgi:hypothetical protein